MLSFLSKHSTRDLGVCLDEIAIAIGVKGGNIQTILVESETEVKPPASISHIQWLDMHWASYLLANPLKTVIGGGRERLLIVIDALDETGGASATGEAGRNLSPRLGWRRDDQHRHPIRIRLCRLPKPFALGILGQTRFFQSSKPIQTNS